MPQIITLPGPRDGPDTVLATQTLAFGEVRQIPAGTNIYSSLDRLYWADHNHASVINSGRIWNIAPGNVGGTIAGYYVTEVRNSGLIVSEAPNGNAGAVGVATGGSLVLNSGQIFAIANGVAWGVEHWDPYVLIDNSGLIAAYAPTASAAGLGDAIGVAMYNGGSLHNRAGASILAEGLSATALIYSRGDHLDDGIAEIRNAGTIEAYAIDPANESVAILTGALTVENMRVENWGIIRGEVAYRSTSELGYSPPQQAADEIYNQAGGEIYGLIDTRLGHDILVNNGLVRGDLRAGDGDDLVDTAAGTFEGLADMGWGDDRFFGGAEAETALGGRDSDWLDGGGGNDLLLGGLGDDTLVGGAGNDGLYGEYGDDRIVADGGDRIVAGDGKDVIEARNLGFAAVDGGAGADRFVLAFGADSLDLAAVRSSGRLLDVEEIETGGQQRLVVRSGDATGLSGGETVLRLFTTATDSIELIGAWVETAKVTLDGTAFRRFTLGGESVLVAGPAATAVAATPSAAAGTLDPVAAGAEPPLPGSVPGADFSGTTLVLNNYNLHDTEVVQSYETWRSNDGQPVLTPYGVDHSIINHGLMESTGPGNGGAKVIMAGNIALIENHGTMRATGTGAEFAQVVYTLGWSALANYGVMEAIAPGGGGATGAAVTGSWHGDVNFLNDGTISARTNGAFAAVGVVVSGDVAAFNHGTISALGGDGTTGAQIRDQRRFTNTGDIIAELVPGAAGSTTGVAFSSSPWGSIFINEGLVRGAVALNSGAPFSVSPGLSVHNSGRLEGAVRFDGGNDRVENRGTVTGPVTLGDGVDLWHGGAGQPSGLVSGEGGTDLLIGSAGADSLSGGDGDDYIRGGLAADTLTGGAGGDLFVYMSANESNSSARDTIADFTSGTDRIDLSALNVQSVSLTSGGGFTDLVATTAAGSLSVRVSGTVVQSDLILTPTATIVGGGGADLLVATAGGSVVRGNDGDDVLVGSAGNDRLEGGGGINVAAGGAGDDVYLVNGSVDGIWEVGGEGSDLIEFAVAGNLLTLPDNVENATMLVSSFVRGNSGANLILGSAGDDFVGGGGGDDLVEGRGGDDRLNGDDGQDTVLYRSAASAVSVDLSLATAQDTVGAGSDILEGFENLVGSGFADTLGGDGAANLIDGGAGADSMRGGGGDDIYVVDNVGDQVTEAPGAGFDTVCSAIGYALGADVENLVLTDAALNGTGNALANSLTGNAAANLLDGGAGADVMAGGSGDDVYVVDLGDDMVIEGPAAGLDTVRASASFVLAGNVENLVLTGTAAINGTGNALGNLITGNGSSNRLDGLDGDDTLNGGLGADVMNGGLGHDLYIVDQAGDTVTEAANAGTDTVRSSVTFTLGANVENLVLTGTGAVNGTGNALANSLFGNGNSNRLDGGAGADAMAGGLGHDVYVVDHAGDAVTEGAGAGTDAVQSSVTFTLGADVETLTLTGTGAVNGTGNALANSLTGNGNSNRLDGGGGADTMTGGLGHDLYVVDYAGDRAVESDPAGGTDAVQSSVTFILGANVENLTLTGTGAINATGNTLANLLTGNGGANRLDGGGGADSMAGGLGHDIYVVDHAGDKVSEAAGAGTDMVQSPISFTLGANVENLTLTGVGVINATGNALANALTGNGNSNRLDGGGGADSMAGGLGHDTYVVDHAGDNVTEAANAGTDTVLSSVTFTLGTNIENLTLIGIGTINGTGNPLANSLTGNGNSNRLDGGAGADTMAGGLGHDAYVVDNVGDKVTEAANAGSDTVQSSVTFTLGTNVENLALTGAAAVNGTGNALANALTGNDAANLLRGGAGHDILRGGAGADSFQFDTAPGTANVDHIADFAPESDRILLENAVFAGLAAGPLPASALASGTSATNASHRILYDAATGALRFDADGAGGAAAVLFAILDTHPASLAASDFAVI